MPVAAEFGGEDSSVVQSDNNTNAPKSVALYTQAVLQGAFILPQAMGDADAARDSIGHLRRYFTLLFRKPADKETAP